MKRLVFFVCLACTVLFSAESVKELKILTIGNSFAWSVFDSLKKITAADPSCKLTIEAANMGGCSLERHWKTFQEGKKPYAKKYSLAEMLSQQKWDVVTIQQVSQFSWRKETYQPYADEIIKLVRQLSPSAEIVVQQTWSYHAGDSRLTPAKWNITQEQMYEKLTDAYLDLAKQYHFRIIPSGLAVQLYRKAMGAALVGPDPATFKDLKQGEIPKNPDIVGNFRWAKDKKTNQPIFTKDFIHLNPRGQYLQGLVWYGFLFGKDPEKAAYIPEKMSKEEADLLKKCAASAIREFRQVH